MTARRKVVHLTTAHRPFDIRIFHKECRTLAAAGYDVVLVAPHDREEVVEGVRVRPIPPARGRRQRVTQALPAAVRAALSEKADLYHFHDLELLAAGYLLKLLGRRVVYDVHENNPVDIVREKPYVPRWIRGATALAVSAAEKVGGWWFDGIVTVTQTIANRFPARKTVIARNFPRIAELEAGIVAVPYADRPRLAVFTGGLARLRCGLALVQAAGLLEDGAQVSVVGPMEDDRFAEELRSAPGWDRLDYRGFVPQAEVRDLLGRARVGLVLNEPRSDFSELSTNKLYEYMAAGLPVVASDIPYWREVVEGCGCGVVLPDNRAESIAAAVGGILADPGGAALMGERGREEARRRYDWDSEAQSLLALYRRILG